MIETLVVSSEPAESSSLFAPNAGAMLIQEHIVQEFILPTVEEEAKEEPLRARITASTLTPPKIKSSRQPLKEPMGEKDEQLREPPPDLDVEIFKEEVKEEKEEEEVEPVIEELIIIQGKEEPLLEEEEEKRNI